MNKIVRSKRIKKDLVKYSMLFDPLVDKNFYCRKLEELSINHHQTETLFDNVGRDMLSLMALLRGHQVGLINKKFIYNVIRISNCHEIHNLVEDFYNYTYKIKLILYIINFYFLL